MAVLFLILKIISIFLIAVLFLLLLLLFVPIKLYCDLENETKLTVISSVRVLFGMVVLNIDYKEDALQIFLRLFRFFKISLNTDNSKKKTKKSNAKEAENNKPKKKNKSKKRFDLSIISSSNIKKLFSALKYIVKKNRLYIERCDCIFSLGEPDKTGRCCGYISMLPFIYKDKYQINPDFVSEKTYFCGQIVITGKIYLFTLLVALFRIKV